MNEPLMPAASRPATAEEIARLGLRSSYIEHNGSFYPDEDTMQMHLELERARKREYRRAARVRSTAKLQGLALTKCSACFGGYWLGDPRLPRDAAPILGGDIGTTLDVIEAWLKGHDPREQRLPEELRQD